MPIGLAITTLIIIAIWYYATQPEAQPVIQNLQQTYVDPYTAYKMALAKPTPEKQLGEAAAIINLIYTLPGWQASQITYDGSNYQITATSLGGTTKAIIQWANENNLGIALTPAGATLTVSSNLPKRPQPIYIYDTQQVISLIIDRLRNVLPERSNVNISEISQSIGYKSAEVAISFNNISPEVLVLIGRELANLPVSLSSTTINIQQGGLLSGAIQLTALGS
jgi:hypothetical protein